MTDVDFDNKPFVAPKDARRHGRYTVDFELTSSIVP